MRLDPGPTLGAPLLLAGLGAGLLAIGLGQPAFVGGRIGPGLFMQGLAAVVLGLAVLDALSVALARSLGQPTGQTTSRCVGPSAAGPLVLGGVVVFAAALPWLGLAGAAAPAAALAALGAGERRPAGLAVTAVAAGLLAAAIGIGLMPPTTRLWPWS